MYKAAIQRMDKILWQVPTIGVEQSVYANQQANWKMVCKEAQVWVHRSKSKGATNRSTSQVLVYTLVLGTNIFLNLKDW